MRTKGADRKVEFITSVVNVLLKDILTFKVLVREKMSLVVCLILKVSLHHQTRLSQGSSGISQLMTVFAVKICHFTPLENPGMVKVPVFIHTKPNMDFDLLHCLAREIVLISKLPPFFPANVKNGEPGWKLLHLVCLVVYPVIREVVAITPSVIWSPTHPKTSRHLTLKLLTGSAKQQGGCEAALSTHKASEVTALA